MEGHDRGGCDTAGHRRTRFYRLPTGASAHSPFGSRATKCKSDHLLTRVKDHHKMTRQTRRTSDRHGEKGAALIISILIATLLLAVAGTVIITTGMSVTTSIEGTAELQAYYAAESGLEDALNIIRGQDRKSTRLNSSHSQISYAVFCLKKKKKTNN